MPTFAVKSNQNSIVHHILKLPLYIFIVANDRLCDVEKELISGSALRIGHLIINRIEGNTNQVQEVVRIQLLRDGLERNCNGSNTCHMVPYGAIWCHVVRKSLQPKLQKPKTGSRSLAIASARASCADALRSIRATLRG